MHAVSLGNGRGSRVEGHRSRVEGYRSRVEGHRSRFEVEVEGQKSRSRVRSRGSKVGNISFLLNISRVLHFWQFVVKILKVLLITNFITVSTNS
jgi:hypothetical protein